MTTAVYVLSTFPRPTPPFFFAKTETTTKKLTTAVCCIPAAEKVLG